MPRELIIIQEGFASLHLFDWIFIFLLFSIGDNYENREKADPLLILNIYFRVEMLFIYSLNF